MARTTKIKARSSGDSTEILVLVQHPMETGNRKDKKTGEAIPAHYIQKITFEHNGKVVAEANLGIGVSANPLTGVAVKGAKAGDTVKATWSDNKGETGSAQATIA